jgi:hypothetical protein
MAEPEFRALLTAWKKEAGQLRERYGLDALASLCDTHANELAAAISRHEAEHLTLKEASAYSGYSTSHLRALIADGTLTNAGRKGSPRLLRGELPRKAPVSAPAGRNRRTRGFDAAAAAEAAVTRMRAKQQPR